MSTRLRAHSAALFSTLVLCAAGAASAQEVVVNGGFETGVLAPFTGGAGYTVTTGGGIVRSGTYALAGFNNTIGAADLTQPLATDPGRSYTITIWAKSTFPGSTVILGLGAARSSALALNTAYSQHTFTVAAVSTSDALHVIPQTSSGTGNIHIDDVSVVAGAAPVAVPTLSEWALILLGLTLAMAAGLQLKRRRC